MGSERRKHVRVAGPFDGVRLGMVEMPVRIYDISEGGCFVNSLLPAPDAGRRIALQIDLPGEGSISLEARVLYAKPEYGFAVSFEDVPAGVMERLERALMRLRSLAV
jgi:hypothetical protein